MFLDEPDKPIQPYPFLDKHDTVGRDVNDILQADEQQQCINMHKQPKKRKDTAFQRASSKHDTRVRCIQLTRHPDSIA